MEGNRNIRPVPQQRIMQKLDEYMAHKDYAGVERHLLYWLREAEAGNDLRGALMIRGEMIGHYRKTQEKKKAHESAEAALALLDQLDYHGSISEATTYVNIATAYNSFGENDAALALFQKAREIYEQSPAVDPALLGGLYNNMGLVCASLHRFHEAHQLYDFAMETMAKVPNGVLEQSVTCLNRANCVEAELGLEDGEKRINALLDEAAAYMDTEGVPRDGYYAYVCEHSAPTFAYYGYFLVSEDLMERARAIYERSGTV